MMEDDMRRIEEDTSHVIQRIMAEANGLQTKAVTELAPIGTQIESVSHI